jgi:hypothetical protein
MKTYLNIKWSGFWLVIIKSNQFYNLVDGKKISMKNLEHKDHTDPYADSCLEMIERLWVWYIVAWTNEKEIVLYNHWWRVGYYSGKQYKTSRAYRFWEIPRNKIMELDMYKIKYNRFTWFTWKSFYDIIIYVSNNSTIIKQDNIKKPKRVKYEQKQSLNLTEEQKAKAWQAKMVGMDVLALMEKMMADTTWETMKTFNQYDEDWIDLEKARKIGEWLKDNFRWTQKRLRELSKEHTSYKKIIENF